MTQIYFIITFKIRKRFEDIQNKNNKLRMVAEEDKYKTEIAKKHVLKYCEPDNVKAWTGIVVTLLYQALAIMLIRAQYTVVGWTFNTFVIVRMFVLFHDMAHFSYFKSISLNKVVGSLLGVYVHFPFKSWRDGHNHHHKHFGNLDRLDMSQTILFSKRQYEKMSKKKKILVRFFREPIVFFLFTAPFVWFFGTIVVVAKRYGVLSKPFFQKIASLALVFFIFPLMGISSFYFGLSIWGTNLFGTILFHLQHSVNLPYRKRKDHWDSAKAALQGSTFLEIPFFLAPFTNGIEYHHIHHLNTNVASYAIKECHESFEHLDGEKDNWKNYGINKVGYWLAFKSLGNVMYDEEQDRLIPFDYSL